MLDPFIGMAGVIGALLVFAALITLGLRIVRWLKLPQDLPEGVYFSPGAPPIAPTLTPAAAAERAQATAARRRLALMAHLAQRAALACSDSLVQAPGERRAALSELVARAKAAAEAADTARKAEPGDPVAVRAGLRSALAARREARRLAGDPPDERARRQRLLLLLVVLLMAWAAAMLLIMAPR